jgi:hypothetical protein
MSSLCQNNFVHISIENCKINMEVRVRPMAAKGKYYAKQRKIQ